MVNNTAREGYAGRSACLMAVMFLGNHRHTAFARRALSDAGSAVSFLNKGMIHRFERLGDVRERQGGIQGVAASDLENQASRKLSAFGAHKALARDWLLIGLVSPPTDISVSSGADPATEVLITAVAEQGLGVSLLGLHGDGVSVTNKVQCLASGAASCDMDGPWTDASDLLLGQEVVGLSSNSSYVCFAAASWVDSDGATMYACSEPSAEIFTAASSTPLPSPAPAPDAVLPVPAPDAALPVPAPEAVVPVPAPDAALPVPAPDAVLPVPAPDAVLPGPAPDAVLPGPAPDAVLPVPAPDAVLPVPAPEPGQEPAAAA